MDKGKKEFHFHICLHQEVLLHARHKYCFSCEGQTSDDSKRLRSDWCDGGKADRDLF